MIVSSVYAKSSHSSNVQSSSAQNSNDSLSDGSMDENPNDSLESLAKAVYVDEKVDKVLNITQASDSPSFSFLSYRAQLEALYSINSNPGLGIHIGLVCKPTSNISLSIDGTQSVWLLSLGNSKTVYTNPTTYQDTELPFAEPASGGQFIRTIEAGGTYWFKNSTEKKILPQVFKVDELYSKTIGNTSYTALNISYFDYPVTVEESYGARIGAIINHVPLSAKLGNGGYLQSTSPANLTVKDWMFSGGPDTTNGWTNESSTIAYLGVARSQKMGSHIDVVHRKTGAKYFVDGYKSQLVYADIMYLIASSIENITYLNNEYAINMGNQPGQMPIGSAIGFRLGIVNHDGEKLGLPWSFELGKMPGNSSWYAKASWGIGSWF